MNIAKWIPSFMRRQRSAEAAFVQLWILDLGPQADDVVAYIAEEQDTEPDGLHAAYGRRPSLYLELQNGDDTLFWINRSADSLEEHGARIEVRFASKSLTGL